MKTMNTIPVRGDLRVRVRDARTGRVIRNFIIRNTITYLGLGVMVQLLGQRAADPAASTLMLGSLKVGEGTTAPVRGDTALVDGSPATVALTDANKLPNVTDPYELRIYATLDELTGNGKTLTEAGLFTSGGSLFARQIHPAITKSSAIVVDYDWRIAFTA